MSWAATLEVPFDARTLYSASAAVFAALALAALEAWRRARSAAGFGSLAAGHVALAAGIALIALRGYAPDLLSVVAANALIVLGAGLIVEGARQSHGAPARPRLVFAATAIVLGVLPYFLYVRDHMRARIFVVSALLALMLARAALAMGAFGVREGAGPALRLACLGLWGLCATLSARAVAALAGVGGGRSLPADWLSASASFAAVLSGVLGALAVVETSNRRLAAAAAAAEAKARRSEESYRSLVESSPDLVYRADARGRVVYTNPAFARVLGARGGSRFLRLVRPDWRRRIAVLYRQQARANRPSTYHEFPVLGRDGRELWIGQNAQLLTERGRLVGFEAIARDVTERKRAEHELHSQKDLFRNLLAVARATSESAALEDTLRNSLAIARSLTGAASASLLLVAPSGGFGRAVSTRSADFTLSGGSGERLMQGGLAGWVARNRELAIVEDTLGDSRWLPAPFADSGRSALGAPLLVGDALLGVLTLVAAEPRHFRAAHARLIEGAAVQMSLALRNARISDDNRRLAEHQRLVSDVLKAVGRPDEPARLAAAAVAAIAERTGWRASLALPDGDGGFTVHGATGDAADDRGAAALLRRAWETGQPQSSAADDPRVPAGAPGGRGAAVPVRSGARLLGVLSLHREAGASIGEDERPLAEALAEALALGLQNASLYAVVSSERARLAAVIEHCGDGIVLVDGSQRVLVASELALRLLGVAGPPARWVARRLDALLASTEPGASGLEAVLSADAAEAGEALCGGRHLRLLRFPVASVGMLHVLRDVTRQREAEQLREDLTRTMVHDLRSPLATVISVLDIVGGRGDLAAEDRALLGVAQENLDRQVALIDMILEVGKLEHRALPLRLADVPFHAMAEDVLRLAAPRAQAHGITLVNEVPEQLPDVRADQDILRRVLENLVANGIKFTPPGGSVRLSAGLEAGAGLRATVEDTGPGVPPQLRPRLFQKFAAGELKGRGSGLGLAFCRLALEAHGGRLGYADRPGGGALFWLSLPLAGDAPGGR